MCAEKELVPLCKPSLDFYTLAHGMIQFLQNPPMEFQADVMRIRSALRDLSILREIIYKADEYTHRLRYKSDYRPK